MRSIRHRVTPAVRFVSSGQCLHRLAQRRPSGTEHDHPDLATALPAARFQPATQHCV